MKIHVIANSHLDPVGLRDWREWLNEGIIACRTMLALLDEFLVLTDSRGESVVHEYIASIRNQQLAESVPPSHPFP